MREAEITRTTLETEIALRLRLDGSGQAAIATGVPFLDHMLEQVARHGVVDLEVSAKGDLHIDPHHTVEDVGIALGAALTQAVGDKPGIRRYGHAYGHHLDAVALLDPQLLRPGQQGLALGAGRGDEQGGKLVDRDRDLALGDADPAQRRSPYPQVPHRLAADVALVRHDDVGAHLPQDRQETVRCAMKAAFQLPADQGIGKLKKLSEWLLPEYPSAAESLLEGR